MGGDTKQRQGVAGWQARLLRLSRFNKRVILVSFDLLLLTVALWIALSIRYNTVYVPASIATALLLISAPLISVGTFATFRLYRYVTRYLGYRGHARIIGCIWLSVLIWSLLVFMSGQLGVPRSVVLGYAVLATLLIAGSREVAAMILESAGVRLADLPASIDNKPVVIYGAGQLGVQLLEALRRSRKREVIAFIDSEPSLWRQYVAGVKVYHSDRLAGIIESNQVQEVLIALPDDRLRERRRVLKELQLHPVDVLILPGVDDVTSGRINISDLRPVDVNDLLGRDKVPPREELLARNTRGKSILVTGAGGSIGSELVRQLVRNGPRRIVLFDVSEVALYNIEDEITEAAKAAGTNAKYPEIVGVLGSVLDKAHLRDVFASNDIDVVYHAAAYKHVPIVEQNPIYGLRNNTLGTEVLVECAREASVELVVLISTDKAVRPTNVMGASKRLAELILQGAAANGGPTVFTMVRFGNVLDSSGSVVKKFRRQIRSGGPVTVTHPEIIRYFMSIPEAAELVIQAGAMAQGGDVFVLDMGEPVRIDDLARLMVRLSGYEVRTSEDGEGDIAITYTGLRSGEKLYEELLIGANTKATEHPRIWRSDEPFLSSEELSTELQKLKTAMQDRDFAAMHAVLMRTVEGYGPKPEIIRGEGEAQAAAAWPASSRTLH
jgi:FlaA1/EpsC-like NDP-sugar epimerase